MKKYGIVKLLSAVALFSALTAPSVFAASDDYDVYNVISGDSLWKIAEKYRVDFWNVVDSNPHFEDPDLIYPDQNVIVPYEDKTPNATSGTISKPGMTNPNKPPVSSDKGNMPSLSSSVPTNEGFEEQVLSLVNKERTQRGLKALAMSENAQNAARIKSEDMAKRGYFSHTSPTYGDPFQMLASFGINYSSAGENIAKGQKSPTTVVNAWMNSEGHRKNILSASFTQLGVGYATSANGTTYWTQIFLRP